MVGEEGRRVGDVLEELGGGETFGSRGGGSGPGGEAVRDGEEVRVLESSRGDGTKQSFEGV